MIWIHAPTKFGLEFRFSDWNNVGHQFIRSSFNAGNHNHLLNGPTLNNNANIAHTGGNQPFDIRNAYTVVQYIIYIQN